MAKHNRWLTLAVVSSAIVLIMIDMTVLYTALPVLAQAFGTSAFEKLWIVNVYALVVAGFLPLSGALTDRYGSKPVFTIGLVIFGSASLYAAFAPSSSHLIAARTVLAIGAATMMPATLAIIRQVFDDPKERSVAIGVWAALASGGAALGPIVGGVLLEFFWWGSVFLINVPIVVIALLLTIVLVPAVGGHGSKTVDYLGAVQAMIGLVALVVTIKEVSNPDATLLVTTAYAVVALVFLVSFVRRQVRSPKPMIDFRLFRNSVFSVGVITAVISYIALVGLEYAISQRFQLVQGLTPLQAGLGLLPIFLGTLVAGPVSGLFIPKVGVTRMIWFSLAIGGAATLALGLNPHMGFFPQLTTLTIVGLAAGAATTAASVAVIFSAPAESAGAAASVEEVAYELGSAIGVAILGGILAGMYSSGFVAPSGIDDVAIARDSYDGALRLAGELAPESSKRILSAAEQAFDGAFGVAMLLGAALLIATSVCIAGFFPRAHEHRKVG